MQGVLCKLIFWLGVGERFLDVGSVRIKRFRLLYSFSSIALEHSIVITSAGLWCGSGIGLRLGYSMDILLPTISDRSVKYSEAELESSDAETTSEIELFYSSRSFSFCLRIDFAGFI
jgi:hypothetical protein